MILIFSSYFSIILILLKHWSVRQQMHAYFNIYFLTVSIYSMNTHSREIVQVKTNLFQL